MRSASARLMPGTRARSSTLADCTPFRPPKCASSACRLRGADAGDLLQRSTSLRALRAPRAVALDREAMRLVADLLQQVQAGMIGRQVQHGRRGPGNTMSSSPGLRSGPLAMPISGVVVQALLGQHLGRDADLPLAAVDHQQVGRRIFAGDDARARAASAPRASPRSRRRRARGVTLKRRYSRRLHRQPVEDDAATRPPPRPSCATTSKHSMRCADGGRPSASCSAASRSSCVAFCASLWPDRELGVLQRHRQPDATLAAGIGRRSATLCPDCARQHFGERVGVVAASGAMIVGGTGRSR